MTNKTINGVIERCALHLEWYGDPTATDRANELRALLAAPDPIVEADGIGCPKVWATDGIEEPAAWQRKSKMHGNCWYPLSSDEVKDAIASGWEVRSLYSADQLGALQSTIAQLKAENDRLQELLKSSK